MHRGSRLFLPHNQPHCVDVWRDVCDRLFLGVSLGHSQLRLRKNKLKFSVRSSTSGNRGVHVLVSEDLSRRRGC